MREMMHAASFGKGDPECSALRPFQIESCQKLVRNRLPFAWIEAQQMTVVGNTVEQLKARNSTGRRECLIIFADQGFVVEPVVVRIEPELRDRLACAAAGIRTIR